MLKRKTKQHLQFWAFILPGVTGFLWLGVYPILRSLYLSFTDRSLLYPDETKWVGLRNFSRAFQDAIVRQALSNSLVYAVSTVVLSNVIAIGAAILLTAKIRSVAAYRTVFFIPSILPAVTTVIMFRWVFDPNTGVVNQFLHTVFGIPSDNLPKWLYRSNTALLTLIIMSLWGFGGRMVIYLAGVNNISRTYYEAAGLDGANGWQQFLHITLPQLSPIIFYNVLMSTVAGFQVFTEGMVSGAANTPFYVVNLYNLAYQPPYMLGYVSALAWILFAIVLAVTGVYFFLNKKLVHYEN
ncbi:MAG: sugar ABC transporter permease [Clostridiales bacterium]|jgi:multiple sugar transport system permease protein|nr:sugar ABC transporter permease [Clostridiales bacterium]